MLLDTSLVDTQVVHCGMHVARLQSVFHSCSLLSLLANCDSHSPSSPFKNNHRQDHCEVVPLVACRLHEQPSRTVFNPKGRLFLFFY